MISAVTATLSGINAATQRLAVTANNIANADSTQTLKNGVATNTPYAPQQLVQSSQANGGVATSVAPVTPASVSVNDPANAAANAQGITQYPNVDPAQQLVQAKISTYDARGNLAALNVEKNTFQSLLDIVS